MTHPYFAEHLVADHDRDIRLANARARLVALARCCRRSRVAASLDALRQRLQIRPGSAACCA